MERLTLAEMKRRNKESGQHWFDEGAMRFFNTKIETKPNVANMFITSEYMEDPNEKRYTWRVFNLKTNKVETLGEFQKYETLEEAKADQHFLKRMVIISQ